MNLIKIMPCLDMKNGRVVKGGASILLAASVFHFRTFAVRQVKAYLRGRGLNL
jgi:imidazole glycerol phosphate synthase subunit HisF